MEVNPRQHEKEDRCPQCDGKGTVDAPADEDGAKVDLKAPSLEKPSRRLPCSCKPR